MEIKVVKDILAANESISQEIHGLLAKQGVLTVNMMSSPGSGKTTILEKTIEDLSPGITVGVIAGDVATTRDAERLSRHTAKVVQIDTDVFGGKCHLEAQWIKKALGAFDLGELNILFIENVGNLICPSGYNLGEDLKVIVLSVAEGEDKPAKYPAMFSLAHAVILNKTDLLPHLDFDMTSLLANLRAVAPEAKVFPLSARTGDGFASWLDWLRAEARD